MHVIDDLFAVGNGVDHGKGHVLRMAGHVADPFDTVNVIDGLNEFRKVRTVL